MMSNQPGQAPLGDAACVNVLEQLIARAAAHHTNAQLALERGAGNETLRPLLDATALALQDTRTHLAAWRDAAIAPTAALRQDS